MHVLLRVVPVIVLGLVAARAPGAERKAAEATPLAVVGSQTITSEALDQKLGNRLFRLRSDEYSLKRPVLDELVTQALLEQEAALRKVTVERLLATEVDEKAKPVQDEEVGAVYESAKQNYANVPEPEARRQIADGMRRVRTQQRRDAFLTELRAKHNVKILMEPPRAKLNNADAASRGPADAPVTLAVFSDFQCPYCSRLGSIVDQLQVRHGGTLRYVFRHFPLPMHKDAAKAAEAALCAQEQKKFWEMHDKLFANQRSLQIADLKRYATEIGLGAEAFNQCLDSGKTAARWRADVSEGSTFGVGGTPTLFVNGRLLTSGANPEPLSQAIEQELATARSATTTAKK